MANELKSMKREFNFSTNRFQSSFSGESDSVYKSPSAKMPRWSTTSSSFKDQSPMSFSMDSLSRLNLPNFNLSLNCSPQSATEKLREVGFAEFNPMTSDAAAWLGSFEKRVTEFGCLDQALSIIIKYLDEFGLDFYRQTIRLVF